MSLSRADRLDRRYIYLSLLLFVTLAAASASWSDEASGDYRTVRVGVYQNRPKVFIDESGQATGLFIDLFSEIAKKEGWKPVYVPCQWAECLLALEEGRIDLMPDVAYSRERDERFDFHLLPVVDSWSRVYASPGQQISAMSDMNGKSVALLRGSIQQTDFAQIMNGFGFEVKMVLTESFEEAFRLARAGTVDAAIANHFFGDYFYREYGLIKTPIVFNMAQLYYATTEGRHADLLQVIDHHLKTWRQEPSSAYYLALGRWMERAPARFVPRYIAWIIGITVGFLVLAGGVILLLRQQVKKRTRHLSWANEELKKSEEQYRHLFESMAQGVIYRAMDGSIIAANHAAEQILGISLDQMKGRVPTDPRWRYLHEDGSDFPGDEHPAMLALRSGRPVLGTLMGVFHPAENRHRWVLVDAIPEFRLGEAIPYRVYAAFSDVTERWRAEHALEERTVELNDALIGTISVMSLTLEKRDPYTAGHQIRVAKLAKALAERLGLAKEKVEGIYLAGVIHDIGKISIPAEILAKPGALFAEEISLIRRHPQIGYEILKNIKFPWPIAQIVLQHHERMDGSGYPQGLAGEAILMEARILAVADVVETISLRRPYRTALGIQAALEEIVSKRGSQFDAVVVDACKDLFQNGAVYFFE